ncbi:MAG: hypothetical protein KDJ77_17195 [Rhodobiaceae bacterium]|nr:hypothetical protein [Rhodobiaceae bacterium]
MSDITQAATVVNTEATDREAQTVREEGTLAHADQAPTIAEPDFFAAWLKKTL